MGRLGPEESCSAALYVFKTYQDLLKRAIDRKDLGTTRTVLPEVSKAFRAFIESTHRDDLQMLEMYVEREPAGVQREDAVVRLRKAEQQHKSANRLALARDQVIFGLAAVVLRTLHESRPETSLEAIWAEYSRRLPETMGRLAEVFGSLSEREAVEFWGWNWWDLQPDGEVHAIDSHSKLNSLFCVKALKILGSMTPDARQQVRLPHSHSLAYLADSNNAQGLAHVLDSIDANPEAWSELGASEREQVPTLRQLLARAKTGQERGEEDALIAAELDMGKVGEFKTQVVESIRAGGHIRALLKEFGRVRTLDASDGKRPVAWGFNQLDDKGPFVQSEHRGYAGWGEAYGRGLAQAENNRAFAAMAEGARRADPALREEIVKRVEEHIDYKTVGTTVVLQSLLGILEFEGIRRRDVFIPKYQADCPKTCISDVAGFMGVLKLEKAVVPVFDVAVQAPELANTVVVADLSRFIQWMQYPATGDSDDRKDLIDSVLVRVRDLNSDQSLRAHLLAQDPEWLRDKEDKDRFLRSHVTINVIEAFELEVLDRDAAISFAVTQERNETDEP